MYDRLISMKSIEDFKSSLASGGVQPTMFQVDLTLPDYFRRIISISGNLKERESFEQTFSILCKAASIPGTTLTTASVALPGGANLKLPGSRLLEPWVCTMFVVGGMVTRDVFEEWSALIIGNATPRSTMDASNYMTTLNATQLDRQGRGIRKYKLEYCWPPTISPTSLDYGANDTIEEFEVSWNTHYVTFEDQLIYDGETGF